MEKLNEKEVLLLLDLVKNEKESIKKDALHNEIIRENEIDLDFLIIKLNTMISLLSK
jgi:hypothetical protein